MDSQLTVRDLAVFTGQDVSRYNSWFPEALSQAEDLFQLATALSVVPGAPLERRLCLRGILAMTEALMEGQSSRELRFTPFRSETIGSYAYSLSNTIAQGLPTGISWFDMATSRLATAPTISNDSVSVYDRPGDLVEVDGHRYLPGPKDEGTGPLSVEATRMYGQAGHL